MEKVHPTRQPLSLTKYGVNKHADHYHWLGSSSYTLMGGRSENIKPDTVVRTNREQIFTSRKDIIECLKSMYSDMLQLDWLIGIGINQTDAWARQQRPPEPQI